ncbi:MAG: ABC transporter permease [Armatimonadetes bacterium]|nr:ABC transporter permease [Armatimonadota bacterium]
MALWESFRVAFEALWANKLRALLTMLGVIIGVASVIIMVGIVQGARRKVIEQFEGIGSNLIFAFYSPKPDSVRRGIEGLHMADIQAVERECTLIGPVSPTAGTSVEVQAGANRENAQLTGVLASYTETQNIAVAEGRFINAEDDATWGKACVIGGRLARKLFGDADPIGRRIICASNGSEVSLTVVGVLAPKDRGPGGEDFNNGLFASLRSVQQRFTGSDRIDGFSTKALDVTQTEASADQVWAVLRRRHPLNVQDFIVDTQEGLLKQIDTVLNIFQLVLGGVGGLSLLTGGIGIMNIMLVSVTERTREIGIRKAVGATRGAILLQFLVEAVVVSGLGGLLGIGLGWSISAAVGHFAAKLLPTFVPLWAIALGFGFATGVGLFFGIYPAFRAAKLDPITALRYE